LTATKGVGGVDSHLEKRRQFLKEVISTKEERVSDDKNEWSDD
jgi:hypothetical protein